MSCEYSAGYYDYDRLEILVDDDVFHYDGEIPWTNITLHITGDGTHHVKWCYIKDETESSGSDCVWIDQIVLKELSLDPIPDLGDSPTESEIRCVLSESADSKLKTNIADGIAYAKYREWANKVKTTGSSSPAGTALVKSASNAWLSFALGSETLIEVAPTDGDLKVDTFESGAEAGQFDFTVSVKDIEVGSVATKENLKKVFGLEGSVTLDDAAFSSDKVEIEFGTPVDGKVKFTAGPKDADAKAFFMKVKLNP